MQYISPMGMIKKAFAFSAIAGFQVRMIGPYRAWCVRQGSRPAEATCPACERRYSAARRTPPASCPVDPSPHATVLAGEVPRDLPLLSCVCLSVKVTADFISPSGTTINPLRTPHRDRPLRGAGPSLTLPDKGPHDRYWNDPAEAERSQSDALGRVVWSRTRDGHCDWRSRDRTRLLDIAPSRSSGDYRPRDIRSSRHSIDATLHAKLVAYALVCQDQRYIGRESLPLASIKRRGLAVISDCEPTSRS